MRIVFTEKDKSVFRDYFNVASKYEKPSRRVRPRPSQGAPVTERRSPAPSVPEIKAMPLEDLFTEAARVQGTVARITTTLAFLKDPQQRRKPEKALAQHERALDNLTAELAARYVVSDEARRAFLFKIMGKITTSANAYLQAMGEEKDTYYELEVLLDEIRKNLSLLGELRQ